MMRSVLGGLSCAAGRLLQQRAGPAAFVQQVTASYSSSRGARMGFEEFFDVKPKPGEMLVTGRAWTVADLRRKSFDDLHKLWFILYKERNLLLSEREKTRRSLRPVTKPDENRYIKVKRSMAGIKVVLGERKRIEALLEAEAKARAASSSSSASSDSSSSGGSASASVSDSVGSKTTAT